MKLSAVFAIGTVILLSAVGLTACGQNYNSDQGKQLKTINWATSANLPTLDPSKATNQISATTLQNSNQGLLVNGNQNRLTMGLAKDYHVSQNGKTYTFHLRKTKWSNGKQLTARDFVYGVQRTVDPKTNSQGSSLLNHLKNYEKVITKRLPIQALGVKADGKYTVVYQLSKPQPDFKYILALAPLGPQSKTIVQKYGSKYGTQSNKMIYSGPFKVTNWKHDSTSWNLVRNKNYYANNETKLERIRINLVKNGNTGLNEYQSGILDEMILNESDRVAKFKDDSELHFRYPAATVYLAFNYRKNPALRNIHIRKAISMAIDREKLTSSALGDDSIPITNNIPHNLGSLNGTSFYKASTIKGLNGYNFSAAQKQFRLGLSELGKKSLNLEMLSDDTPTGKSTLNFVKSELNKLPGLNVNKKHYSFRTQLIHSQKGQFDILVTSWFANYPDPIDFLQLNSKNSPYNYGKWNDAEFEKNYELAENKDAEHPQKRWQDMIKADQILQRKVAIVPLYQKVQPQVIKSRVKGLGVSQTGGQWDFRFMSVE